MAGTLEIIMLAISLNKFPETSNNKYLSSETLLPTRVSK